MYVEKKTIGGKSYFYLKESKRKKGKIKTRTVSYLGKATMSRKELSKRVKEAEEHINEEFLSREQLEHLEKIKEDFSKKIKNLDKKLIEDMFRDFKTHYIYNTTAIEGNTLTLEEANLLLNENKTPEGKDLKEIYDHINERDAFDYLLKEKPKLDLKLMIKIHSMLLRNIDKRVGEFRKYNVRVFGADFETSNAKFVYTDLNLLMKWYKANKNKLHPLILSAVFHEKFERIHPFYDGNGRTGRMIVNLILIKNTFPPLAIKNEDRLEYYKALSEGHKANLIQTDVHKYKSIVLFFYDELVKTYEGIFEKWL